MCEAPDFDAEAAASHAFCVRLPSQGDYGRTCATFRQVLITVSNLAALLPSTPPSG